MGEEQQKPADDPTLKQMLPSGLADIAQRFFQRFKKGERYIYFERLEQMPSKQYPTLVVDYLDIDGMISQDGTTNDYAYLIGVMQAKPKEAMVALRVGAWTILNEIHPAFALEVKFTFTIRLKNYTTELEIPNIRSEHVGNLISLTGIVSMIEQPSLLIIKPVFVCHECGKVSEGMETRGLDFMPMRRCPACSSPKVELDLDDSEKMTYQRMNIQQLHEKVEPGSIAADIESVLLGDDIINTVNPGERVRIIGFVKLKPKRPNSNAWFDYYIEVNNIINLYEEDIVEDDVSEKELLGTIDPKNEDAGFYKLVRSITPSVKGLDEIKTACLFMGVSSEAKILPDGSRLRGDINTLLIGDPGTAKSTILRFMAKTMKRAAYASGKGGSKAGLTATVIRESNNSMPTLQAGHYLICDRGIACVDELEKISADDREALPNLMDDVQILAINKYGINKEIPCRAASLHACNPVGGKWDDAKNLSENVEFAHWLFDRYDLKFVIRNQAEEKKDDETSKHFTDMLSLATSEKDIERKKKDVYANLSKDYHSLKFLKAWFSYVRKHFDPEVSPIMMQKMREFYLTMRKQDSTKDITMREMGALYRIARASARAHMRNVVMDKDVEIGKKIILKALISCGMNPETGEIDFSLTQAKLEGSQTKTKVFKKIIKKLDLSSRRIKLQDIIDEMMALGYNQSVVNEQMTRFRRAGWLVETASNIYEKTPEWADE